jgi:hypothetical protein
LSFTFYLKHTPIKILLVGPSDKILILAYSTFPAIISVKHTILGPKLSFNLAILFYFYKTMLSLYCKKNTVYKLWKMLDYDSYSKKLLQFVVEQVYFLIFFKL